MQGLLHHFGRDFWKRRGAIVLVLLCWAIQGAFYWGVGQHVDAATEKEERQWSILRMDNEEFAEIMASREAQLKQKMRIEAMRRGEVTEPNEAKRAE